jgi:protein-disulfide isomerase
MKRRAFGLLFALFAAGLIAAACGGDDDDDDDADAGAAANPPVTGAAATGTADASPTPSSALVRALEKAGADLPRNLASGTKLGRDDAPLKVEVFEDFQCPFCLRYTAVTEPGLVNDYVKTGKLQFIFRALPILGRESVTAAVGAFCAAEQDRFWDYHNLLFLTQARAGQDADEQLNVGRFDTAALKQFAADLGLDVPAFDGCYDPGKPIPQVQDDQRRAQEAGLRGTPSFLLNGRPLPVTGSPTLAEWKRILDQELSRAPAATATAAR